MSSPLKKAIYADPALSRVISRYAVAITPETEALIKHAPDGAVARQYVPDVREALNTPDELVDPIGDNAHSPLAGIVHRYADRVLLKPVHVCAVYCRFCFRREAVGPGGEQLSREELAAAIDYIAVTPSIWEVILTGGDPLVLSPRKLGEIIAALSKIDHVKIIRIHTRLPIAAPTRVSDEIIAALETQKTVYAVLHCNHADELTTAVEQATQKFIRAGIPLLSQSTLLAGVNDDAVVLEKLYRRLTEMKIKPYYLHHPDKAPGTSHFRLSLRRGQEIMGQLWARLSGIARPAYMLDIPGGHGKITASEGAVTPTAQPDVYKLRDPKGNWHIYSDTPATKSNSGT